jgi:hypothetical protein
MLDRQLFKKKKKITINFIETIINFNQIFYM